MKTIDWNQLATVTGGAFTPSASTRRASSGSSTQLQTALTGVTSALDSLKQNQGKGSLDQMLPLIVMAKWMNNR